jgi:signal transduction histidine kinase
VAAIATDPRRLGQVIDNLLSNAVKYTLRGGAVTVTVRSSAGVVELEVADTGIGISEDALPHVFTRFFRSTEAVSSSVPGVGLGLAITRALVDALGGRISVESQPGRGTRVGVTLTP